MPPSATDKVMLERIENEFTYHAPTIEQAKRCQLLRDAAKGLAYQIVETCPDSRERSYALTQLQSAVMFANASIALHDPDTVH